MSKGGTKTKLPAGLDALSMIQAGGARKSIPLRNTVFSQLGEALRTGGVKARIPMIQQAVSQSRSAASRAISGTSEELARRNIGGSFAGNALAGLGLQARQQEAGIPTKAIQQLLAQGPGLAQVGYPGAPVSGSAGSVRPDTMSPAIGAGGEVIGALIKAFATPK